MTTGLIKHTGLSIRQRLLNHAKAHGDDYQRVLTRYAIERLLFRLSQTEAREQYILKGAMLFVTWPGHAFRPTGDLDLLGHGNPDPTAVREQFTRICSVEVPADGILFDPVTLQVEPVREDGKYHGLRVHLKGRLAKAEITVQVDIGFADAVYPAARLNVFPGLLNDLPTAEILMYPPETVISEKFEAMIRFGEANSRIKDFYDVWVLSTMFSFDLDLLSDAVAGTLDRRETALPTGVPIALTQRFVELPDKQALWTGFLRRNPPTMPPPPLSELVRQIESFLGPVLAALATSANAPPARWNPDRARWE